MLTKITITSDDVERMTTVVIESRFEDGSWTSEKVTRQSWARAACNDTEMVDILRVALTRHQSGC